VREYELLVIVNPDVEPESVTAISERLTGLITGASGEVHRVGQLVDNTGKIVERPAGDWQKRKLAYPIRKKFEGYYLVLQARMNREIISALERSLQLDESVMRKLLVRLDDLPN
jgi:small subunit ribosomal protein S6